MKNATQKHSSSALFRMVLFLVFILNCGVAVAQDEDQLISPKVLAKGFSCFLANVTTYLRQGDTILVNFETCPNAPTRRDRLEAQGLVGSLPSPRLQSYVEARVLQFTRSQILCLVRERESILFNDLIGNFIAIEPEPCGTIGYPLSQKKPIEIDR